MSSRSTFGWNGILLVAFAALHQCSVGDSFAQQPGADDPAKGSAPRTETKKAREKAAPESTGDKPPFAAPSGDKSKAPPKLFAPVTDAAGIGLSDEQLAKLEAEAAKLVDQLGDEQYSVREQASEKLTRMGLPSLKAIARGSKHVDREIRYRCERILVLVQQLEFEKRLEAFLSDPGNGESFDFPGWNVYRKLYGDSRELRLFFVEMQRAEPELMASVAKGKAKTVETITTRGNEIQQTLMAFGQEVPIGSVAAMLFVALAGDAETNQQAAGFVYNFCYQQSFRNALTGGKNKDILRKMIGAWVQRGDEWIGYQGMMLALQYDLQEGMVPAERMLKNDNSQPHLRQYAIVTVAKFGNDSHLPLLEKMLQDQRVCGTWQINNNVNISTQVRDVALAALVHLSKQEFKQYGFDRIQMTQPWIFNPHTAGFEKNEKREEALKKWEDFKQTQKKGEKPS